MDKTKPFSEALQDGYEHITDISDPKQLNELRRNGIQIDSEGMWVFNFGDSKEFEVRFEPILADNMYYVSVYRLGTLITEKVPVMGLTKELLEKYA